jgi:hypothetical protein
MAPEPPILTYAAPKRDRLARWLLWLLLAELALIASAVGTGIAGDLYDWIHPMSWRGARVTSPIYHALFLAAGLLCLVIVPLGVTAWVRHRRRAG